MPQELTIVLGRRRRVILLSICCLGLIYQALLLVIFVLLVIGLLCGSDGSLMGESVEDADGESGPSEDLNSSQLGYS